MRRPPGLGELDASGAELANIINEAALLAVKSGRDRVSQSDLEECIEVVIAGCQRKGAVIAPKEKRIIKIVTCTGGRAAEELIFNTITSGASNDIEQATKIAKSMVTRLGMSDSFDMMALETINNPYLGGDSSLACSAETSAKINQETLEIIKTAHAKATAILKENLEKLHDLARRLLEKETITGEEFMEILKKRS